MGHINAGLEWLVQAFNEMWPLVLATFAGAWLAFQHIKHYERRKEVQKAKYAGQYAYFVINSQHDQLKEINEQALEPHRDHARRAVLVDTTGIHNDFPKLNMDTLPSAFDQQNFTLMNKIIACEQKFIEVAELLQLRSDMLLKLEDINEYDPQEKHYKTQLRKSLSSLTDRIYDQVQTVLIMQNEVLDRLKAYLDKDPVNKNVDLADYFAWVFLAGACAVAGVFFFSHWALNSEILIRMGLDISLVSALVFAISLYSSLALCFIVFILVSYSLVKKLQSFSIYFWTFLVSAQPVIYLLWLEAS